MTMPSADRLTITLPASLGAAVETLSLQIVTDKNGKRAIQRNLRDANASDAGRTRRVEFEFWGPIGRSLESASGGLGVDFLRNLEARYQRQLTSSIAQVEVDLTGDDPPGLEGSVFDIAIFDTDYFGSDISGGSGGLPPVTHFAEQNGYLLVARGLLLTQVDMNTTPWTVITTTVLDAPILDMDHWFGNVYIALGSGTPMQRVVAVLVTGPVLEDVTSDSPSGLVYATAIKRGNDRVWYVDAEHHSRDAADDVYNFVGYTLDAFSTLAFPFQVGDPMLGVNGLGPFGPFTAEGQVDAIYTFTPQGATVKLSKALDAIHSTLNGAQFADPGFGWNYYTSIAGLRAFNLGGVDNPIGVGERMRGFTGHNGLATAIFPARGELFVVYRTTAGALYGYRCQFGNETGGTGQPLMFPWFYMAAEVCGAIFTSTTPNAPIETTQQLTVIRGAGTNLKHMAIAATGMDNLSTVTYSVAGGSAYLTTLDRNPNLLKNTRLLRARAQNMTSGDAWAFSASFDANPNAPASASYSAIGSLTANGETTITPVTAGVPQTSISGHSVKIKIDQTAAGSGASTSPPALIGNLDYEYDERPEQIEEFAVDVLLEGPQYQDNQTWHYLNDLVGSRVSGAFATQWPDDIVAAVDADSGGGQLYCMLNSVTKRQDASSDVEAVTLVFTAWPAAAALSA